MKCFLVEGNIKDAGRMTDEIMNEHMACTRAAMERGMIFMSGLKEDMSGGLSVMGAEDAGQLQDYLDNEPLFVHGIQEYRVVEFDIHYVNKDPEGWFGRKDEIVCE